MEYELIRQYDNTRYRHQVWVIDEKNNSRVLGTAEFVLGRWKISGGWPEEYRDLKDAVEKILSIYKRVSDEYAEIVQQDSHKLKEK